MEPTKVDTSFMVHTTVNVSPFLRRWLVSDTDTTGIALMATMKRSTALTSVLPLFLTHFFFLKKNYFIIIYLFSLSLCVYTMCVGWGVWESQSGACRIPWGWSHWPIQATQGGSWDLRRTVRTTSSKLSWLLSHLSRPNLAFAWLCTACVIHH